MQNTRKNQNHLEEWNWEDLHSLTFKSRYKATVIKQYCQFPYFLNFKVSNYSCIFVAFYSCKIYILYTFILQMSDRSCCMFPFQATKEFMLLSGKQGAFITRYYHLLIYAYEMQAYIKIQEWWTAKWHLSLDLQNKGNFFFHNESKPLL